MIMKFEDRLKQYRENKGWTQAELGKKSGVSSRMIQRYEAGTSRPRWDAAEKIATALEVPVSDLLGQSGMLVAEAADKGGAKSAREMSKLVEEVVGMFAGGSLPKEDRDAYMAAISKAYFESNEENKKYTPKKHRK
jgi:transcriptional regulator with XRE-family HTH domain